MANEVVVDALPYIDTEYEEPGVKEMVQAMIEEEKKRYRPTKNYLEHLSKLELHRFESDLMKKEYERLGQRLPMETLSMKRYELPPPPTGKLTDLSAWNECVENSSAQLEHQNTRICNLELMQEYSTESWKSYLSLLSNMVTQSQKQLSDIKRRIQEVNWDRKCKQVEAGEKLKRLESSWVGLVSKNYEIEKACIDMENRVHEYESLLKTKQQEGGYQNRPSAAPEEVPSQRLDDLAIHQRHTEDLEMEDDKASIEPQQPDYNGDDMDQQQTANDDYDEIGPQPIYYPATEQVSINPAYVGDESDR